MDTKMDATTAPNEQETEFKLAYDQLMRPINNISAMITNSKHEDAEEPRNALVAIIHERLGELGNQIPPQADKNNPSTLKDVAAHLKFYRQYFKDGIVMTDEEALEEAHVFKLVLLDGADTMLFDDLFEKLKNLAPDAYEKNLTTTHAQ